MKELDMTSNTNNYKMDIIMHPTLSGTYNVAVGMMHIKELTRRYSIDRSDPVTKTGYQRAADNTRVNQIKRVLLNENPEDIVLPVTLNFRNFSPSDNLTDSGKVLMVNDSSQLFVVDGQHRLEGFKAAIAESPHLFNEFMMPVTIGLQWSEHYEIEQFHTINTTAKGIEPSLALEKITELFESAEYNHIIEERAEQRGDLWKIHTTQLVNQLNDSPGSVWFSKIKKGNQDKTEKKWTVPLNGFVNSLKPVVHSPLFTHSNQETHLLILDAYWNAILKIYPGCLTEPQKYSLQKSLGVSVMHSIFNDVAEIARKSGEDHLQNPEIFHEILNEPLSDLLGTNGDGEEARSQNFWLSGKSGAAGGFSSGAGKKVLINRLKNNIKKGNE